MQRLISLGILFIILSLAQVVRADDLVAPIISNVKIASSTADSVTITWVTNEKSDSAVNYGLQPDYGITRIPIADKTTHSIVLNNLESGRTYYFRVVSADAVGNQGISADYKIQTEGAPQSGQSPSESTTKTVTQSESQTTENIVNEINKITSPEKLQQILNQTVKAIKGITEALTIVGPPTVIPETTSATVTWTTDRASTGEVSFTKTQNFSDAKFDFSQSSTDADTTQASLH